MLRRFAGNSLSNSFSERADNAAALLKSKMGLPESKVVVGSDGHPPPPPPPDGSYAAMIAENAAQQAQQLGLQNPPPPEEVQAQPEEPIADQQPQPEEQVSPNAQNRIRELVDQLRDRERAIQELNSKFQSSETTTQELNSKVQQMEAHYNEILQQNLDSLDPETLHKVRSDQLLNEAVSRATQAVRSELAPTLKKLEVGEYSRQMEMLSSKYSGFDPDVHPYLIEDFRKANPNCSVEQAFRAVAAPGEIMSPTAKPVSIPQVLAPGSAAIPRSVPDNFNKPDPQQELAAQAKQAYDLRRSDNPAEQKLGMRMLEENLARRLGFR